MINERLESALAWCKKNNIESIRLEKFNRESKKKQSKKKRRKFLIKKAKIAYNARRGVKNGN